MLKDITSTPMKPPVLIDMSFRKNLTFIPRNNVKKPSTPESLDKPKPQKHL